MANLLYWFALHCMCILNKVSGKYKLKGKPGNGTCVVVGNCKHEIFKSKLL